MKSWKESLKIYSRKESWILLILGFASGLPLYLYFGPLSYWLREAGVTKSTIGFFSWVGMMYTFKIFWSPLVDRLPIPILTSWLGRRKSWAVLAQVGVAVGLVGIAMTDPQLNLYNTAVFVVVMAFFSATQDIVIDAYRIEIIEADAQGALAATYTTGYRIAGIFAGAGALYIASFFDPNPDPKVYDYEPWRISYLFMAAAMLLCMIFTILIREPKAIVQKSVHVKEPTQKLFRWFYKAFLGPFVDFIGRYKWHAVLILSIVGLYRISDIVIGTMVYAFYVDMGFTKVEVANASKIFGSLFTILGGLLGGVLIVRYGIMRILFFGALMASVTNILFFILSGIGHNYPMLIAVISVDNISAGIATVAFIGYMSSLTNVAYSATQYALFTSLMLLIPNFIKGFSGVIVDTIGYNHFFIASALIGIPVLILIGLAAKFVPAGGYKARELSTSENEESAIETP